MKISPAARRALDTRFEFKKQAAQPTPPARSFGASLESASVLNDPLPPLSTNRARPVRPTESTNSPTTIQPLWDFKLALRRSRVASYELMTQ